MPRNDHFTYETAVRSVESLHLYYGERQDVARAAIGVVTWRVDSERGFDALFSGGVRTGRSGLGDIVVLDALRQKVSGAKADMESRWGRQEDSGPEPRPLEVATAEGSASKLGYDYGRTVARCALLDNLYDFRDGIEEAFPKRNGRFVSGKSLRKFAADCSLQTDALEEGIKENHYPTAEVLGTGEGATEFAEAFKRGMDDELAAINPTFRNMEAAIANVASSPLRRRKEVVRELEAAADPAKSNSRPAAHYGPQRPLREAEAKRATVRNLARMRVDWIEANEQLAAIDATEVVVLQAWVDYLGDSSNPSSKSLRTMFGEPEPGQLVDYLKDLHDAADGLEVEMVEEIGFVTSPSADAAPSDRSTGRLGGNSGLSL